MKSHKKLNIWQNSRWNGPPNIKEAGSSKSTLSLLLSSKILEMFVDFIDLLSFINPLLDPGKEAGTNLLSTNAAEIAEIRN